MKLVRLTGSTPYHLLDESTVEDGHAGRQVGRTYCGLETNDRVDTWLRRRRKRGSLCGSCWRQREKRESGGPVAFHKSLPEELQLSRVPLELA